jgi:hypothetical protein
VWELKTARDLKKSSTFVRHGSYLASACKITADPAVTDGVVTFTARPLWSRSPADKPETLTLDQRVYVLACTCNGMAFIANRWTFTGECKCVHHQLPREG